MQQHWIRSGLVVLAALLVLAILLVPITHANPNTTFNVTKVADTNDGACTAADCSLREAIGAANLAPGSTVVVPAGTYVLTRTGYNEDANATGDLDILASMTISSATGVRPTIQAAGGLLDRVMQTMTNTQVTLNNIMIFNGTSNVGGGIDALGDLTLNSVYVVSNTASWGGGIFIDGHALTLTNGVVWVNTATGVGGGIASQDSRVLISNSLIMSNNITGLTPGSGYGGGIAALNNATNTIASRLTVINSTIVSNTTPAPTATGAGIYGGGNITLTNVNLYANQSGGAGGGLYSNNPAATVIISGGSFMTNTALGGGGGGFFNYATLIMTNTLIQSNTASGGGGFINNNGVITMTGGQILSNTSTNPLVSGGGIRSFNYLKLVGVTLRYNSAVGGSGGAIWAGDQVYVIDSVLTNNSAVQGGGLQVQNATLDHTTVTTNTALYGGGLFNSGTTLMSNGSTVNGNTGFQGGGVFNNGTLIINTGSVISNATTPSCLGCSNGGGVYNANVLHLNAAVIASNTASNGSGAGVFNAASGNLTAVNSAIISNTSGLGNGGGISNTGTLSMTNVTLSGNATNGDGGGLANGNSVQLAYVTLANNTADNDANGSGAGGGVANTGALTVTGTIIGNNQVKTGLSADCAGPLNSGDYNVLETLAGCTLTPLAHDHTSVDPALDLLTNLNNTWVHPLLVNSVAVNQGHLAQCPATDQRGVARPIGSSCDIGAFESAFLEPQTITFDPLPDHGQGEAPFVVTATASSGLSVTFTSLSTSVCTVNVNVVTLVGVGSCTLRASQAGNAVYSPAPNVDRTFTVKQSQTISFALLPDRLVSDPAFPVTATASSGLPVSFSAGGVCVITGTQVTLSGVVGTCTITATQPGNGGYLPAPDVVRPFAVRLPQTIAFAALPDRANNEPPFIITATASSNLVVAFNASGECVVTNTLVTLTGNVGLCTITARQSGDATYAAAPNVPRTFAIKQAQAITFNPLPNQLVDAPPFIITATASSNLPVLFKAGGVCNVADTTVTLDGITGTCTITATQPGDNAFAPAPYVERAFSVGQPQTITFGLLPDRLTTDPAFAITATAASGLAVSFSAGGVCTVNGAQVTLTGLTGTCTITATQPGDATFVPAIAVARSFIVRQAQSISFAPLPDRFISSPPFIITATASSGLDVAFKASGLCEIAGSEVTLSGLAGTCTITATQAGNVTYAPALEVARTFKILYPIFLPLVIR